MFKRFVLLVASLSSLVSGCGSAPPRASSPAYYQAVTTKPYADVMAELRLAITDRNFRITGHNKIGSVIRERENIPFPDYDTVQFCNLTHAREMLQLSPATVIYMPCNVAVRSEQGKVIVTTHLLPTDTPNDKLNQFAVKMNEQLRQIVDFAAED